MHDIPATPETEVSQDRFAGDVYILFATKTAQDRKEANVLEQFGCFHSAILRLFRNQSASAANGNTTSATSRTRHQKSAIPHASATSNSVLMPSPALPNTADMRKAHLPIAGQRWEALGL
jgi:hypothetical protein